MTKNGKKRIERAKKILGEITTHDLDNLDQAEIIGHIRDVECFRAGINVTLNTIDKYKAGSEV